VIIKNARIASSKGILEANLFVEDGKVVALKKTISGSGEKTIDATGLFLLPGLIDAHVHFRDPGAEWKEDFFTGTRAALAGGVTVVFDMPNTAPSVDSQKILNEKKKIISAQAACNYALYFGASEANQNEAKQISGACGLKIYMGSTTGSLLVKDAVALEKHFQLFPKEKIIAVHGEDEETIKKYAEKYRAGEKPEHNKVRPPVAVETAARKAIELAKEYGKKLHVCHLSTEAEMNLVKEAKKEGVPVSCEATPHHLFLSEEDAKRLENFGKMNPPLRSRKDVAALWENMDAIDLIATDHAPHTREEKEKDYWSAPSGVPGVETMLPLLLNAVNERRISLEQVVEKTCENPAKLFGLKGKGFVAEDFDADFVLVDLKKTKKIAAENLFTKCGWSPFEGMRLRGSVERVFMRGEEVFDGENVFAKPGSGSDLFS
jgi:dihydroorotase